MSNISCVSCSAEFTYT